MLRLYPFELLQPHTLGEAVFLLEQHHQRARILAGGTDLLPTLKQRRLRVPVLISLSRIKALREITIDENHIKIGAGVTLQTLTDNAQIKRYLPVLADAASKVATPQIRNRATLGGNICLDTRCRYINKSPLFRENLQGCLKSGATACRVVPGGKNCVAAICADTVPPLIALNAKLHLVGSQGTRCLPLSKFYCNDGEKHVLLNPAEIVSAVEVPLIRTDSEKTVKYAYRKWAPRKCIDFPVISLAIRLEIKNHRLQTGVVVVGALASRPRAIDLARFTGTACDENLKQQISETVFKTCKPLPNIPYEPAYRRRRLKIEVERTLEKLL